MALFKHPDPRHVQAPGGSSIAFEVSDLEALTTKLQEAGIAFQGDIVRGPRCRMRNLKDSEGNGIILHELTRTPTAG